jgi:hypothetical protein
VINGKKGMNSEESVLWWLRSSGFGFVLYFLSITVVITNCVTILLLITNLKIKVHKTIILSVVLCGFETWSLTLREGRRLRVFENRVLRAIFGILREKVTVEWRKLHNEELYDLYC